MKEILYTEDGIVIDDRELHQAIGMSYGEMFKIVHKFLNEFYRQDMITTCGKLRFTRLKEGNGSPYPIVAGDKQFKYQEILGLSDFCKANATE